MFVDLANSQCPHSRNRNSPMISAAAMSPKSRPRKNISASVLPRASSLITERYRLTVCCERPICLAISFHIRQSDFLVSDGEGFPTPPTS